MLFVFKPRRPGGFAGPWGFPHLGLSPPGAFPRRLARKLTGRSACFRTAVVAVAADLDARDGDADARIAFHLPLQLFEEIAFHFTHFAAAQAGHVDMISRAVPSLV